MFALPISIVGYLPTFFFGSLLVRQTGEAVARVCLVVRPCLMPLWQVDWRTSFPGSICVHLSLPCKPTMTRCLRSRPPLSQVWFGVEIVLDWMVRSYRKLTAPGEGPFHLPGQSRATCLLTQAPLLGVPCAPAVRSVPHRAQS